MESYQSIGIVMGIIGIALGLFASLVQGYLIWVALVSIAAIIIVLVHTKHHKKVGITLVVLGILGNLLLIIPGAMAIRYKPEGNKEIKSQTKNDVEK